MRGIPLVVALALAVAACGGGGTSSAAHRATSAASAPAGVTFYGCQGLDPGYGVDVYATGQTVSACDSALGALGFGPQTLANGTPGQDGQPVMDMSTVACTGTMGSVASGDDVLVDVTNVLPSLCGALPGAGFTTATKPNGNPYYGG